MSHLVDQILEQVRARLDEADTYARRNVEKDRDWPIAPPEDEPFDWLLVNEGADRVTDSTPMRPRRLTIDMEVRVRAICRIARVEGTSRERCRALMLQVQKALLGATADTTLGKTAKFMRYQGSDPLSDEMGFGAEARELTFIVTFQTSEASFEAST